MSEKYLHRNDAPFGSKVWEKIDETVVAAAKSQLCGRRILQIDEPYGLWLKTLASEDKQIDDEKAIDGTSMYASCPAPVIMIQSGFKLSARDIAAFEQTKFPLELGQAARAAISCAQQEDSLIFNGSTSLKLDGLLTSKRAQVFKLKSWDQIGSAADDIIGMATLLDEAGFAGPYILALAPKLYNLLLRRYPQGEATELEHIRQIATEGIIKASAISSGGIFLNVGQQFASIVLGQDLMTSFVGPSGSNYEFNVTETAALRLVRPEAICVLQQ